MAAVFSGVRRWTEPWYGAYALAGMMILGVAPIFIPLTVEQGGKNGSTTVGLIVAAFYLGGLLAPVLGSLADRKGAQRRVFLWCFPVMSVCIVLFALTDQVWSWFVLALIAGGGGSLVGTVAGLFIVEAHPEAEWNQRLGWFRLAYGAGQVVGLVIAAVAATQLQLGWIVTAVLLCTGFFIGRIGLPRLSAAVASGTAAPASGVASATVAAGSGSPAEHGTVTRSAAATSSSAAVGQSHANRRVYILFLVTWLLTMTGVQTFFNVVPLVMRDGFHVSPSVSSVLFLIGAGIGTVIYPLAGGVANKIGPGMVLLSGMMLTIVSFGAMAVAVWLNLPGKTLIGSVALVVAASAYSFEVVAATMMIVKVTPGTQGSAMGLLNGVIAAGAVIGAIAPSFVAAVLGYESLPAVACALLVVAAAVGIPLYRPGFWLTSNGSTSSATEVKPATAQ